MFRRRRLRLAVPLLLLLAAAGCAPARRSSAALPASRVTPPSANSPSSLLTPTPAATATVSPQSSGGAGANPVPVTAGTATPAPLPPDVTTLKQANRCGLINSSDLAHLFPPHNEIVRDPPKTGPVDHPPFSSAPAPGTETSCQSFTFHQPGSQAGWMLQVTYRLDAPGPSAAQAWRNAWADAKAAGQPVSGLGDDAFASGANLYIKKGDAYIAFESIDTHIDGKTAAGAQALLGYEQQLAAALLGRLQ